MPSFKPKAKNIILSIFTFLLSNVLPAQDLIPFRHKGSWAYYDLKSRQDVITGFEEIQPFRNQVSIARRKGKWGVMAADRTTILPYEYDEIIFFSDNLLKIGKGTSFQLYNPGTRSFYKGSFKELSFLKNSGELIVFASEKGLYGLMNIAGKVIIPAVHINPPQELTDELLGFAKRNKSSYHYGLFNLKGKQLISYKYENFRLQQDHIEARKADGTLDLFKLSGKKIWSGKAERIQFILGKALVVRKDDKYGFGSLDSKTILWLDDHYNYYNDSMLSGESGKLCVIMNADAEIFRPGMRGTVNPFTNGYAAFTPYESRTSYNDYRLRILIDKKGRVAFSDSAMNLYSWNSMYLAYADKKGNYGMIRIADRSEVLPFRYARIRLLRSGYIAVQEQKGKYRILKPDLQPQEGIEFDDFDHRVIIPGSYTVKNFIRSAYYPYEKIGIMDDAGKLIFPVEYHSIERLKDRYGKDLNSNVYILSKYENSIYSAALARRNGEMILPFGQFHGIFYYGKNLMQGNGSGPWGSDARPLAGVLDTNGKILVPLRFEKIYELSPDGIISYHNGRYGYYASDGKKILEEEFHGIRELDGDFLAASKWKFALFSISGERLTEYKYSELTYERNDLHLFRVKLKDKEFFIDNRGNEYYDEKL